MKLIYCLMILLCPVVSLCQQAKPLSIGDKVPDLVFDHVVNYKNGTVKLSDLKGKLVILDFMHTSCRSCLQTLLRFESLQKEFKQNVAFLIITTQKKENVNAFLQKTAVGKKITFPFITGDTSLQTIFPFTFISHLVWIGPDGVVKAITHGDYVTPNNLNFIVKGGINHWPVKLDEPDFDYQKPLLVLNPQIQNLGNFPVTGSFLLPYLPEVAQYFLVTKDTVNETVRTVFINQPITEMYLRLVGKTGFPHSQIQLKVKDSSRYIFD
jgi:thiol-disulfide isomerase/thioredoxin